MTNVEKAFMELYKEVEPELLHHIDDLIERLEEDYEIKKQVSIDLLKHYINNGMDWYNLPQTTKGAKMSLCCNAPIKWTDICIKCLEHCDKQELTDEELNYLIQSLHPQFNDINKQKGEIK